eukprot:2947421-Prymnesium_polylepis.1
MRPERLEPRALRLRSAPGARRTRRPGNVRRRVARRIGRARRAETSVGGEQSAEVRRVGRG